MWSKFATNRIQLEAGESGLDRIIAIVNYLDPELRSHVRKLSILSVLLQAFAQSRPRGK